MAFWPLKLITDACFLRGLRDKIKGFLFRQIDCGKSENFALLHASTNECIFEPTGPLAPLAEVSQRGHCILT